MTTSYPLTGDFNDLLVEEPRITGAWLETNLPAGTALVDLDANKVLLSGPKRITLDASNTFSISLIATNSTGTNVTDGTLRYRVRAQYSDGTGVPRTWESGFFDLTAAADLSDKVGGAGDLDVTIAPSASLIDAPTAANVTGPSQTRTALDAAIAEQAVAYVDGNALDSYLESLPAWTPGLMPIRRIAVKPGTYTRTTTLLLPSGVALDATGARFVCATPGTADELLGIVGASYVSVTGGVWDGDKASFATATEFRHGVNIIGSNFVTLDGMQIVNAKGDGIYVGDQTTPCEDITFRNIVSRGNHRNGLGISAVTRFRDFGSVYEDQAGTHPQSGLDIEPNTAATVIDDVVFTGCAFINNAQYGAMVSNPNTPTVRQGGVKFIGCRFDGNGAALAPDGSFGVRLHSAQDVSFVGGQVRSNTGEGVYFTGTVGRDVSFVGVEIARNGKEGIRNAATFTNLSILDCTVRDNGQSGAAGTYDGINLETGTSVIVAGTTSTGAQQRYGVRTLAGVTRLTLVGNNLAGNGTGNRSLADEIGSRFAADRAGIYVARDLAGDSAFETRVSGDTQARFLARADGDLRFGDGSTVGDTRLYRSAADTLRTNDNFIVDLILTVARNLSLTASDGNGFVEMREQTADPAAPTGNLARIFFKDNGAGKTQMCVRFATGAVQILATEP